MDAHIGQVRIHEDGTQSLLIHYAYTTDVFSRARSEKIACAPNLKELEAQPLRPWPWHRSNDPRAVTCPQCQRTEVFQDVMVKLGQTVAPQSPVHLLVRKGEDDSWLVACVPAIVTGPKTDDPRSVTCVMCKATPEFAALVQELVRTPLGKMATV